MKVVRVKGKERLLIPVKGEVSPFFSQVFAFYNCQIALNEDTQNKSKEKKGV